MELIIAFATIKQIVIAIFRVKGGPVEERTSRDAIIGRGFYGRRKALVPRGTSVDEVDEERKWAPC